MRGTIKSIQRERGYAFIRADIGDVFMHQPSLDRAVFADLRVGQRVVFTYEDTPKGWRATVVSLDV